MRRDEWLAGAPILRGRWSTIACFSTFGYLVGRTHPIYIMITENVFDVRDLISNTIGFAFLALGVLTLDQYGRNCWFSWAPDEARWDGRFTRDQVKRQAYTRWLMRRLSKTS